MSQYATIAQLFQFGMPGTARATLTDTDLNAGLVAASAEADGYLRGRYAYPLLAYGEQLPMYVCWLAAYLILSGARGYNPAAGADSNLRDRYDDARGWFEGVQAKRIHPDITPSDGQSPRYDQPVVLTSSVVSQSGRVCRSRGW
jgi:phage gp36-like protein